MSLRRWCARSLFVAGWSFLPAVQQLCAQNPPIQPLALLQEYDVFGLVLGRYPANMLVLPDPCPLVVTITTWPGDTAYTNAENYTVEFGFAEGGGCSPDGEIMYETFRVERRTAPNQWTDVTSYFTVGGGEALGTGVPMVVSQTNYVRSCVTWVNFTYPFEETEVCSSEVATYINPTPAPVINPSPYVFDAQHLARCAQACFAATAAFGTAPYFSLGAARNVTLAYHGDRVDLRPFVHVKVKHLGGGYNTPSQFWLQVKVDPGGGYTSRTFTNGETTLHFTGHADTVRLGGQLDVSDLTTGAYPMQILVTSQYSGSTQTTTYTTKLVVVNERNAVVARGWTIAGVQRLYPQSDTSALITEGDGSAIFFNHPGAGPYTTPLGAFSKLTATASGWTRAYPDSLRVDFDNLGRMIRVRDRLGNRDTLVYYDTGSVYRVKQIRDPLYTVSPVDTTFRRISFSWNANGLSAITDGFGRTTTVWVRATSRLLDSIADPGGGKTKYGYDGSSRLATLTDRGGNLTTLAYDSHWRLTTITAPAVPINGGSAQSPVVQLSSWQKAGVPLTATISTAATSPKADTIQATVTDPEGNLTKFKVDRWGQPIATANPIGQVATIQRNGNGQPVRVTSPYGVSDSMDYQTNGLMVYQNTNDPAGAARFYYNGWATPYRIQFNSAYEENYTLDSKGSVTVRQVGSTILQRTWYDSRGRPDSTKDAGGHRRRYVHGSPMGQITLDSAANGLVTRTWYDSIGRDTASQVGSQPLRSQRFDALNRLTMTRDSVGNDSAWTFTYDSVALRQIKNPRGLIRYQSPNALGWVVSTSTSASGSVADSSFYDRSGRVTRYRNRNGQNVRFTYDSLSRVKVRWDSTGSVGDTTTYNDAARTVRAANANAVVKTFFNTLGQVDSTVIMFRPDTVKYTLRNHWGCCGLRDSLIPQTAGANPQLWARGFSYPVPGYLGAIRFGTGLTKIGRNVENKVVADSLPSSPALVLLRSRTAMHTAFSYGASDATVNGVAGRSYQLDSLARIIEEGTNPSSSSLRDFFYDRLGRLVKVKNYSTTGSCVIDTIVGGKVCGEGTPSDSLMYSYDALGNRTDLGGAYTLDDRILRFNSDTFTVDAAGRITKRRRGTDSVTYTWSPDGLLTRVDSATTWTRFFYDAGGELVRRTSSADTLGRYFLWDGAKLLAEFRKTGNQAIALVAEYSWYQGLDVPHAVRTGTSTVRFFVTDGLGNVTGLTAGSSPVDQLRFDAWGKTTTSTGFVGDTIRPRWKGAFFEPGVGLYYLRNRWLDPATGRFISEDPIGLKGGNNLYSFGGSEPVNTADPMGLDGLADDKCEVGSDDWFYSTGNCWDGGETTRKEYPDGTSVEKAKAAAELKQWAVWIGQNNVLRHNPDGRWILPMTHMTFREKVEFRSSNGVLLVDHLLDVQFASGDATFTATDTRAGTWPLQARSRVYKMDAWGILADGRYYHASGEVNIMYNTGGTPLVPNWVHVEISTVPFYRY